MERFFIKVNQNIETHIAGGKGRTFTNLTDKTLKTFEKQLQTEYSNVPVNFLAMVSYFNEL